MAEITLELLKEGEDAPAFELNLAKGEEFKIQLFWSGDDDLDLHGLHSVNRGAGAKISSVTDILSTYNVKRVISGKEVGALSKLADGSFEIHGGALSHSPDALNGNKDGVDEFMIVRPDRLTPPVNGAIDIPIIVMIHPQQNPQQNDHTFKHVKDAVLKIFDSAGAELLKVNLSANFGEFNGMQAGSIMVDEKGSRFVNVGVGFMGNFNAVVRHYT